MFVCRCGTCEDGLLLPRLLPVLLQRRDGQENALQQPDALRQAAGETRLRPLCSTPAGVRRLAWWDVLVQLVFKIHSEIWTHKTRTTWLMACRGVWTLWLFSEIKHFDIFWCDCLFQKHLEKEQTKAEKKKGKKTTAWKQRKWDFILLSLVTTQTARAVVTVTRPEPQVIRDWSESCSRWTFSRHLSLLKRFFYDEKQLFSLLINRLVHKMSSTKSKYLHSEAERVI